MGTVGCTGSKEGQSSTEHLSRQILPCEIDKHRTDHGLTVAMKIKRPNGLLTARITGVFGLGEDSPWRSSDPPGI